MATPFLHTDEQGSFSGVDIKGTLTILGTRGLPIVIDLANINAVSWSTHRDKVPVRRIGRSYAQAYTHGPRTIAGSLVFINFNKAALWDVISTIDTQTEDSPVKSIMTDQLPPFNIHFLLVNEDGLTGFMSIFGIEIVDEGMVMGTDEAYLETTMQYIARDIDLLNPGPNLREAWESIGSEQVVQYKYFSTQAEAQAFVAEIGNGEIVQLIDTGSGEFADGKKWQVTYTIELSRAYMSGLATESNKRKFIQMLNSQGFDKVNNFSLTKEPILYYDSSGNPHLDRAAVHEQWRSMDPTNPDRTEPAEKIISKDEEAAISGQPGLTSGSTLTTDTPETTSGVHEPQSDQETAFQLNMAIQIHAMGITGEALSGVSLAITNTTRNRDEGAYLTDASGIATFNVYKNNTYTLTITKSGWTPVSWNQTFTESRDSTNPYHAFFTTQEST